MRVSVVGAGVAGCHAALTLLERGHEVDLWDVGRQDPTPPLPGTTFHALKDELPQPIDHLLGGDLRALVPPVVPELLRYPPSRHFLAASSDPLLGFVADGFHPYASFATGGLANGWGANALPADLRKGIADAVTKAEDRAIPASDGIPEADIQVLRDKGMEVTVLTKAQEKVMADAMQPAVIKAFIEASPDGARLIEMMRKL